MPVSPTTIRHRLRPPAGHAFADSRDMAATFGKEHYSVLRDIRNLNCSSDFRLPNFRFAKYEDDSGREKPCYEMTRDGFTRLVMSFTGEKAARATGNHRCGTHQHCTIGHNYITLRRPTQISSVNVLIVSH
ncbi:Rha family transcriptional regulator [Roseiarcus sp.]|uniref:Rha family transcriptional regulator n=1 Tax=Roseiarcus sp. TaxID=1969460 RepID=UPI003C707EBB